MQHNFLWKESEILQKEKRLSIQFCGFKLSLSPTSFNGEKQVRAK